MSASTWDRDAVINCQSLTATGTVTSAGQAWSGTQTLLDGVNIVTGTATGSIIAATTAQKVGFWGATPIVQPAGAGQAVVAALTDNSGGASGGNTIAVVTDNASAANAIATLAAKVNALNVLVTALRLALVNAGLAKGAA